MKKKDTFGEFNQSARKINGQVAEDPHHDLWKTWNDNGRKEKHLEPLLDALEPTIQNFAKRKLKGLGGSIPYSALEQQLRIAAKKGLDSYDPSRGTKVRTHIITNFQRSTDFVASNRNFAHIPKPRVELYQRFQNAKHEFMEQHGHEPTLKDMKALLPDLPEKDLKPMMSEIRRELYIGGHPDPEAEDGSLGHAPSQVRSILSLMPTLLSDEEKKVFDHIYPTVGEPLNVSQIAKSTGMNANQVYRVRSAIFKKVQPHLKGL